MSFSVLAKRLCEGCPTLELRAEEPMSKHTSFHIGGTVRLMAIPTSAAEALFAVRTAASMNIIPLFMGNGSNLLVADEGLNRFVIKCAERFSAVHQEEDELAAESGISLARLAVFACEHGLSGLEFAHGIPGSLGGAVMMNAGAYGGEMAQVVWKTDVLTMEGETETILDAQHAFAYRRSAFSDGTRLILGSRLKLRQGDCAAIRARMKELMERRREKQPLEFPSAGSAFKRPEGYFAAALIEQCGLKGLTVGGAQVSEKHAGFIINRGGATCADVLRLMEQVRETVLRQAGITLEPEIKILGW